MADLKTSYIIELINRVSGPAKKVSESLRRIGATQKQLDAVSKATGRVGHDMSLVAGEAGKLAGRLALLGGAGLWFVKSQLIDTASQFEKFRAVLETIEGSSAKAQVSMDWVSDFAAKTPYELDEVMESFVRLRSYGLDPTNGLLRSLGDTASAMGKPIMAAVEAIADAVTSQNERLKEFGITAETKGARVRYSYTDKAGKQQFKIVDKNNRAMIQSTLEAIWNEKYGGAMERQSRTWAGMMSNIGDQWTRFKVKIMDAGLFDWLKSKLGNLLATLDRMAADGSLQKLAADIGIKLKEGFIAAWKAGEAVWKILTTLGRVISWLAGVMGGYENLAIAVAVLMSGKLLLSIASLVASFYSLGAAAIPVASTALATLIPLLTSASVAGGGLLAVLGKLALVAAAFAGGYAIGTVLNEGIGKMMESMTGGKYSGKGAIGEWLYDKFNPEQAPAISRPTAASGPNAPNLAKSISTQAVKQEVGGTLKIEIEGAPARVKQAQGKGGMELDVDTGRTMLPVGG